MSRSTYKWLTLRVPQEFADRLDVVIAARASSNRPLVSRAQAIREAMADWMEVHNIMVCNSFQKGSNDEVRD